MYQIEQKIRKSNIEQYIEKIKNELLLFFQIRSMYSRFNINLDLLAVNKFVFTIKYLVILRFCNNKDAPYLQTLIFNSHIKPHKMSLQKYGNN